MSVSKPDEVAIRYAATCNPPRRAKRPRTSSVLEPVSSSTATTSIPTIRPAHATQPLAHIAPARSMSVATDSSDYDPNQEQDTSTSAPPASNNAATSTSAASQPKRRGRKPSTISRAARESARRQNHSRIEKARRTKINDALAALRELVPATVEVSHGDIGEDDEDDDEEDDYVGNAKGKKGRASNKGSKAGKDKEFKLEVLERTVIYVQELQGKVAELERTKCSECANNMLNSDPMPSRSGQKRKRDEPDLEEEEEAEEEAGEEEECPPEKEPTFPMDYQDGRESVACPTPSTQIPLSPASSTRRHSTASQSIGSSPYLLAHRDTNLTRLPSINTWLSMPHHLDPSALPTTTASASIPQLLTPPQSTELPPTIAQHIPPTLSLDLPPTSSHAQSVVMSRSSVTSTVNAASPPVSAGSNSSGGAAGHGQASSRTPLSPWTSEDESAASLLLHIRRGKTNDKNSSSAKEVQQIQRVQTPSSLLGMKVDPHMRRT